MRSLALSSRDADSDTPLSRRLPLGPALKPDRSSYYSLLGPIWGLELVQSNKDGDTEADRVSSTKKTG